MRKKDIITLIYGSGSLIYGITAKTNIYYRVIDTVLNLGYYYLLFNYKNEKRECEKCKECEIIEIEQSQGRYSNEPAHVDIIDEYMEEHEFDTTRPPPNSPV